MKKIGYVLLVIFLSLPYFKPSGLANIAPGLEQIFDVWKLVSSIIIFGIYIYQNRISHMIIAISMFQGIRYISTFINGGDYWRLTVEAIGTISLCMLVEIGVHWNIKLFLKTVIILLMSICILNLLTIIIFPNGMFTTSFTENWILGYDNVHIIILLPLAAFFMLYAYAQNYSFIPKAIFLSLIFSSVYITWSATSVAGVTIFIILCILNEMNIRPKILNMNVCLLISAALFLGIVVFRAQDIFAFLIEDVLGKNVITFSGRTSIWDAALKIVKENLICGCGVLGTSDVRMRLNGASHAHNYFLQILFETGFLGLFCFIINMFILSKSIKETSDTPYGFLMIGALLCYFLMFQAEAYDTTLFWGVCELAYCLPFIVASFDSEKLIHKMKRYKIKRRHVVIKF